MEQALAGQIIPVVNPDILAEYSEVLRREKFHFKESDIQTLLDGICKRALFIDPVEIIFNTTDIKDIVFYAVAISARQSVETYLITGNLKHFPPEYFVLSPRDMLTILCDQTNDN